MNIEGPKEKSSNKQFPEPIIEHLYFMPLVSIFLPRNYEKLSK